MSATLPSTHSHSASSCLVLMQHSGSVCKSSCLHARPSSYESATVLLIACRPHNVAVLPAIRKQHTQMRHSRKAAVTCSTLLKEIMKQQRWSGLQLPGPAGIAPSEVYDPEGAHHALSMQWRAKCCPARLHTMASLICKPTARQQLAAEACLPHLARVEACMQLKSHTCSLQGSVVATCQGSQAFWRVSSTGPLMHSIVDWLHLNMPYTCAAVLQHVLCRNAAFRT